ncbi:MAG: serine acetyltransferase [Rikenellaceae bacterium]
MKCTIDRAVLAQIVDLVSQLAFPEYLLDCCDEPSDGMLLEVNDQIAQLLGEQLERAFAFEVESCDRKVDISQIVEQFMSGIPAIKQLLSSDLEATYRADPAARSYAEVVLCYPSIVAMTHHRIACALHLLDVPIIPRMIAEQAHSKCGIDIHPGAQIDSYFAIDHGTGVVIGETTIIGRNVVIYQGVTLGARGFRYDENGDPINIPRHPIIEDNVRIYSNSSILGRITIGHDSIIGGNMWIDCDVAPRSKIVGKI